MTPPRDPAYLVGLVRELCKLPHETEWVEFKTNFDDPQRIGELISALANGAALTGKPNAYIIWGIEDETHSVVGATFSFAAEKKGNEPLENWVLRKLRPRIDFRFHEVIVDEQRVGLLEIDRASRNPVAFDGDEFIRVGSVTKKLREYPEKERDLWRIFDQVSFEGGIADERVSDEDVLLKLDYPAYFDLLQVPLPDGRAAILDALRQDDLIARSAAGGWNVTNLGAILLARKLYDFPRLRRKAMRVIKYNGAGRFDASTEREETKGYAAAFTGIVDHVMALVSSNEVIERSLRKAVPMFPKIAVRELVSNALIHQDFSVTGAGPMVEMFQDRIEITNPGEPLVNTDRFVDAPPKSRNEALASLMRRFRICEERGSGIDRVVAEVEAFQLPAPLFEAPVDSTRAILFAHKPLSGMGKTERIRACYMHACLRYVTGRSMNNASLRERFDISKENSAQASRLLKEALDSRVIVIRDPEAGTRSRTYLPFWAGTRSGEAVA